MRRRVSIAPGDPGVAHVEFLQGSGATYARPGDPLPSPLAAWLERDGIQLYTHQARAIEEVRGGCDVVMTTPTASGKTLAFTLPVLERLIEEPGSTALYLYPTKALANDQLRALKEIEKATRFTTHPAVYDGDTPPQARPEIRNRSRIILSNPYELHHVLPWHAKWHRFLSGLRVVVVDEAHRYRGIFGSNVALLIRRLRRICWHHGSDPHFILSTATLANPEEFAEGLTGRLATLIEKSGAPQGSRRFVFINPRTSGGASMLSEAKRVFLDCMDEGLQTLCFAPSRKTAELLVAWAREELEDPGQVATYRAGYLPEERRQIERGLKEGHLRGVVTTNALELGIDVGGLDAVVIAGYPGSISATWQQAGRAGRTGEPALTVLVANEGPLDQYYMSHPHEFFGHPHEHAVLDPSNPAVLAGHLLCAAAELPISDLDPPLFGSGLSPLLEPLAAHHLLRETPWGYIYSGRGRAVDVVDLAGIDEERFTVTAASRILETLDRGQAYREAHPGAILLHQGETYRVTSMDLETRCCTAEPVEVDYHTQPIYTTSITPGATDDERVFGDLAVRTGEVTVVQGFPGYRIRRLGVTTAVLPLELPPLSFETIGCWWTVAPGLVPELADAGTDPAGSLHGAEHALIGVLPLHVLCDRNDVGGFSTLRFSLTGHPGDGQPGICMYDSQPGGTGLARKTADLLPEIVASALELVQDCPCEAGCPSCIYSPRCGNGNQPLDKRGTAIILKAMLESATTG
ncbi:ATP-dependent RNA helicase DbpA [anaerobic digester metagenome]